MTTNKSFSSETAGRYALALFEISKENSELKVVNEKLITLLKIYRENKDFKNFIQNPTKNIQEQSFVLKKISGMLQAPKNLENFLNLLVKKRRIFFLERIIDNFIKLVSIENKEVSASIISSKKLSENEIKKLNGELSSVLNSSINLNYKIDESLIGGFKIQIGSLMIDSSIKNKLRKYEKLMLEN